MKVLLHASELMPPRCGEGELPLTVCCSHTDLFLRHPDHVTGNARLNPTPHPAQRGTRGGVGAHEATRRRKEVEVT